MPRQRELDIRRIKFQAALNVATVLKVVGMILIVLAIFVAVVSVSGYLNYEGDFDAAGSLIATAFGTGFVLVAGALLSAAGYALDLLVEIYSEVWHLRVFAEDDDDIE